MAASTEVGSVPELLEMILGNLSASELRRMRLVNGRFQAIVDQGSPTAVGEAFFLHASTQPVANRALSQQTLTQIKLNTTFFTLPTRDNDKKMFLLHDPRGNPGPRGVFDGMFITMPPVQSAQIHCVFTTVNANGNVASHLRPIAIDDPAGIKYQLIRTKLEETADALQNHSPISVPRIILDGTYLEMDGVVVATP